MDRGSAVQVIVVGCLLALFYGWIIAFALTFGTRIKKRKKYEDEHPPCQHPSPWPVWSLGRTEPQEIVAYLCRACGDQLDLDKKPVQPW